ncbi:MAG: ribose-phosphate diphosphokinase [Alphaproteobacteria bacterium]|nr:ribose-phosphate diphosphokinase [Alphaproteobacteria bacterium]MBM3654199.1 ribose-phosphate diphosphokinase [Alphaproteobacteria bacterium]
MKPVAIQCLPSSATEARRVAARLGVEMDEIAIHAFPDGEIRVAVGLVASVTIVLASLDRPNDKLLALLFASEALRRGGARRLVLVAPYLCYMRQDAAFQPGEAISQRVVGALLSNAFDRIVTVDAHLHRTTDIRKVFPNIDAENLSAMPVIADALRMTGFDPETVVVGPDSESEAWVGNLAGRLELPHLAARKIRRGDNSVDIDLPDPKAVAGHPVLLVDDLVSSGGTLTACARALNAAGAKTIDAIVTHALFPPATMDAFARAGIRSVRSTTSVLHPSNAFALDALLAAALQNEQGWAESKKSKKGLSG